MTTSLPTVVRTLASLERDLGVSLLKRTTRRFHLTDEGTQYLERCRDILAATQEAEDILVARRTEPVGSLSITASVAFGRRSRHNLFQAPWTATLSLPTVGSDRFCNLPFLDETDAPCPSKS